MENEYEINVDNESLRLAEELYWKFSEFENLTTEEVKKCCDITLKKMSEGATTKQRAHYDLARVLIKTRGKI